MQERPIANTYTMVFNAILTGENQYLEAKKKKRKTTGVILSTLN